MKRTLPEIYGKSRVENTEKLEFTQRCMNDFIFFSERVLGYDFSELHHELVKLFFGNRFILVVIPRGFLKTTICSVCYPLWRMYREKGIEICQTGSAMTQSIKSLKIAQLALEENDYLKFLVPESKDVTWNKNQLTTTNGNTYYVKPFSDSARGIHVNYLIADDILRNKDVTHDQIKDTFWSVFFPTVQTKKGQILVVGTPQSVDDLFAELKKKKWKYIWKSAILNYGTENEKSLWPEGFTLKELYEIRNSMTVGRFNIEYMTNPTLTGSSIFPLDKILECTDDALGYSYDIKGSGFLGCDFALSGSKWGDFSVFVAIDSFKGIWKKTHINDIGDKTIVEVENPVIIRKIDRMKGLSFEAQVRRIKQMYESMNPCNKIIIDSSTFGQVFLQDLRSECLPVDGQDFSSKNRNILLIGLSKLISSGRLVIPNDENDPVASRMAKILIRELSGFKELESSFKSTTKHDDVAMATALAVKNVGSPRGFVDLIAI